MLDNLDHGLIAALRADSRTSVAVLARDLGVNRSTVTSRIARLVSSGVIEGFTVRLSNDVDRDAIRGVTMVRSSPNQGSGVVRETATAARTQRPVVPPRATWLQISRNTTDLTLRERLPRTCCD